MPKIVSLSDETYAMLKKMKREGESFSEIINRLVAKKPDFPKYAGTIPELPSEEIKKEIRKWRAEYDRY